MVGDILFGATCVGTIEAQEIGYSEFIHVAVNPWRGEQIAFIDTKGKWGVWDFSLRQTQRSKYAGILPKSMASGNIYELDDATLAWANIVWGSVENELLIATRRELFEIDITV